MARVAHLFRIIRFSLLASNMASKENFTHHPMRSIPERKSGLYLVQVYSIQFGRYKPGVCYNGGIDKIYRHHNGLWKNFLKIVCLFETGLLTEKPRVATSVLHLEGTFLLISRAGARIDHFSKFKWMFDTKCSQLVLGWHISKKLANTGFLFAHTKICYDELA